MARTDTLLKSRSYWEPFERTGGAPGLAKCAKIRLPGLISSRVRYCWPWMYSNDCLRTILWPLWLAQIPF